jgi:heptosyltransferase-2
MRHRLSKTPERILVVPLRFIGDTVLSVPLIRNLKLAFPNAQIDVLASKVTAPLLEPWSIPNRVLVESRSSVARFRQLQSGQYDALFLTRKSFASAIMAQLAGIPNRVGFDKQRFPEPIGFKRWGLGLTHVAEYPSLTDDTPHVTSLMRLLDVCEIPASTTHLELWTTPDDDAAISALLEPLGLNDPGVKLAAIHCTSPSTGKSIDPAKFIPSLQRLHREGYAVLATGLQGDRALYDALAQESAVPIVNLAGQTTLRQTVRLYRRLKLLLSVDSGPIHLAAAAGVPAIVGVYGPTNHNQWAPFNEQTRFVPVFQELPCRPCYPQICEHNQCRTLHTGEGIQQAVEQVLR